VLLVLLAATAEGRTLQGVLGDAQERVGLRPAPVFTTFASHFATLVTTPSLTSSTSAALTGGAVIDSSMGELGPIFLDHAATLGQGVWNVNAVAQRGFADASLFGQPFAGLGLDAFPLLERRTPTGNPGSPTLLGIRLRYQLDLHLWAAAFAASYGVTDSLDVSLVLPVIATRLSCAVRARVVAAQQGGRFVPVMFPPVGGTIEPVSSTGIGDLTARLKYRLPVPEPWRLAATVTAQFPTCDPLELHGNGAYWLAPGLDVAVPLWDRRAELTGYAGMNVNLTFPRQTEVLYGLSGSVMLWPKRLAAILEFLGASQLTSAFAPHDTDVLVLTPSGVQADPLLGIGWTGRVDEWSLAFGLRGRFPAGLILYANGLVPLNRDAGVRPAGVIPTVGLGWSF